MDFSSCNDRTSKLGSYIICDFHVCIYIYFFIHISFSPLAILCLFAQFCFYFHLSVHRLLVEKGEQIQSQLTEQRRAVDGFLIALPGDTRQTFVKRNQHPAPIIDISKS